MADPSPSSSERTPAVSREQMRLVLEISRTLTVTTDLDVLLARIARAAATLLGCERASVFLHEPRRDELWTTVALQSDSIRVSVATGIVGLSFRTNQVIHCPDAYADPRFNAEPDRLSGFLTRDLLAAPMVDWDAQPVGVLQAVNKISGSFTETDAALVRLLSDQAGVAVQRWNLQQQAIQSSSLQHEMQIARRVQEAMVPKTPPVFPGLRCAGWTRPASINGGDCYDMWTSGDRIGVLVADASGHGIAAALVVSQVRSLVRTLVETEVDPVKVLWRINERLAADLEPGRFVTAFLAFVKSDGSVDWCSAGHGSTLLFQPGKPAQVFDAVWPPLGLMEPDPDRECGSIQLQDGASLIVLSDGLTEAMDAGGDLFGVERVIAALQSNPAADPEAAIAAVRDTVTRWQGAEDPADDQTMIVVQCVAGKSQL